MFFFLDTKHWKNECLLCDEDEKNNNLFYPQNPENRDGCVCIEGNICLECYGMNIARHLPSDIKSPDKSKLNNYVLEYDLKNNVNRFPIGSIHHQCDEAVRSELLKKGETND